MIILISNFPNGSTSAGEIRRRVMRFADVFRRRPPDEVEPRVGVRIRGANQKSLVTQSI